MLQTDANTGGETAFRSPAKYFLVLFVDTGKMVRQFTPMSKPMQTKTREVLFKLTDPHFYDMIIKNNKLVFVTISHIKHAPGPFHKTV